jgi:pyridoxamine 5'-phosphate oxidase family protein
MLQAGGMTFTDSEREYLATQRLGRLATVAPDGYPQNNPVGFWINAELGTVDIGGYAMGASRKFHSVQTNPRVSFVVDDIASVQPWRVRGVEVRGDAEAMVVEEPPRPGMSNEIIRIHPRRIRSWGFDPAAPYGAGRTVR